ncbi:MAG: omptin family outer membrane protease [Magnetococcales bacterium]|nr:omptin family outer membrane protease [Magnetococcales bacterium]
MYRIDIDTADYVGQKTHEKPAFAKLNVSLIYLFLLMFSTPGLANQPVQTVDRDIPTSLQTPPVTSGSNFTTHIGVANLNGESNEYVYDYSGNTVSELNWKLENLLMLNMGISIKAISDIKLNADLWIKINDGSGSMDDYDYSLISLGYEGWTDWSHSDNVPVDKAYMIDINAEIPIAVQDTSVLSAIIGYKRDNWRWKAYGGNYIYSTNSIHDSVGSSPANQLGITYEQWWNVPYVGLGFNSTTSKFTLRGRVIGSVIVQAFDEDHHHLRDLIYEEEFTNGNMYAADIAVDYQATKNMLISGSLHYQKYDTVKGTTTITDLSNGQISYYSGDVAGADNTATMLSFNLVYGF